MKEYIIDTEKVLALMADKKIITVDQLARKVSKNKSAYTQMYNILHNRNNNLSAAVNVAKALKVNLEQIIKEKKICE